MIDIYSCQSLRHFRDVCIKSFLILALFIGFIPISASSNPLPGLEQQHEIKGNIKDEFGDPIIGVTVLVKGTTIGTSSDIDGNFSLKMTSAKDILVFKMLGFTSQEIIVDSSEKKDLEVVMAEDVQMIDEVVVVGFGSQKKESMVSAISTIDVKELKGPTSNLTTMLAGRIAGVISYQRSGEPGEDNAQFFIRGVGSFGGGKVNPLILIDGIESSSTDLSRLQPDDIESFSVLKDATATSIYGARGANGVMLVNTKGGFEGKTKFSFRVENSISTNTRNFQFADNITYMQLANEAALTRDPLAPLTYTQTKIDYTKAGANPLLYPSNNWIDQLIKPSTMNQRYNLNVSGGGGIAKFYLAATFNVDNGVLRDDSKNNFKNNVDLKNYSIRSNTNLQLTRTTEAIVRMYGQFDDYSGPIGGGGNIFNQTIWSNPVQFPAIYPASYSPYAEHPLFGSAPVSGRPDVLYNNPYASMVSGYQTYKTSNLQVQAEFKQDFSFITPGLSARAMGYTQRHAYYSTSRKYNPFYYSASSSNDEILLTPLNDGGPNSIGDGGSEYLSFDPGDKITNSTYYGEVAGNYDMTFNDVHAVSGMMIGTLRNFDSGNAGNLQASLPARNVGLSGRFTYGFDSRYMLELNFGYNASERFAKNHRWGFFPSVGGGWNVSNEEFFNPLKSIVGNLKIRASYGLVGNDQIGNVNDRFFYMSNVNLNDGGKGASFGQNFGYHRPGVTIGRYANERIGWEESRQLNVGLDASIFDISVTVDVFQQKRSNILMTRSYIPGTLGLQTDATPQANVGKAESSGFDLGIDYNKDFRNGFWTQLRANFTYATSNTEVVDEPSFPMNEYYRSRVGLPINQPYGLIAERLFIDDHEVANSPKQNFGKYQAGDIKYRDVNGDGEITDADMVPIGFPHTPEIIYGFGGTLGYKDFDVNLFFQGSARSSFSINPGNISPFVSNGGHQNGLIKQIAESHWSEDNRDSYAFWPRLGNTQNDNNNKPSTWWLRNGAFLRLKSVEVGYNLPNQHARKIGISNLRVYFSGSNFFAISKFKMWDPEMGGDGLGYPVQRVYNIGISFGI